MGWWNGLVVATAVVVALLLVTFELFARRSGHERPRRRRGPSDS
jgi:hypothetical protein